MRWESLPASCSLAARKREFGARMNQIRHGLGLGEIKAAIEKGAPGEFAGFGQARAVCQNGVEHQSWRAEFRRGR